MGERGPLRVIPDLHPVAAHRSRIKAGLDQRRIADLVLAQIVERIHDLIAGLRRKSERRRYAAGLALGDDVEISARNRRGHLVQVQFAAIVGASCAEYSSDSVVSPAAGGAKAAIAFTRFCTWLARSVAPSAVLNCSTWY